MLEILSWIDDYPLKRVLEIVPQKGNESQHPEYLRATNGSQPNIVVRPGQDNLSYLNFVLAGAPKAGSMEKPYYVVLPARVEVGLESPLLFLTLDDDGEKRRLIFCEERRDAYEVMKIGIQFQGKGGKWALLWFPSSKQVLEVEPSNRRRHCDFSCVVQDRHVGVKETGTRFTIRSYSYTDSDSENVPGSNSLPPLYSAVLRRDFQIVKELLSQGADAKSSCKCGTTAMSKAAESGALEIVNLLLDNGAAIKTKNLDGESPEDLAVRNGYTDVVERLWYFEAELVERLLHAARDGSVDAIQALLDRGVTPNARNLSHTFTSNFSGNSALEIAAQYGREEVVLHLLSDANVNANEADRRGVTALHKAAQEGHIQVIRHLKHFGADPNVKDNKKMTPLHKAAQKGHVGAVNELCSGDNRADLNSEGPARITPLKLAERHGRESVVKLLIDLKAATPVDDSE